MMMHHRRKQRFSSGSCQQHVIDEEQSTLEPAINVDPENRTDNKGSSILISHSDNGELQEKSILPKKRGRPLSVKRKITQMTEEEQLALAVKISQQEQTIQEKYSQEEEDELIKKAIEESLHVNSCPVPDTPIRAGKKELTNDTPSNKEHCSMIDYEKETHSSNASMPSAGESTKSPFVMLQRLSQDIVKSSSVILSPNCKDPVSCIERSLKSPLSPCTSSDFVKLSPAKGLALSPLSAKGFALSPVSGKGFALSPVFPKRSPCLRRLIPCRLFKEGNASADCLVDDLDDQCTHCSESSQMDSPSSVLPTSQAKEKDCVDASSVDSNGNLDCRSDKRYQSEGTVHYYWGVPFCPKGADPSEYTKVILCQLEVYQKSLKSAQRQLLHKMDYGQPIHLAASGQENVKEDTQGDISHEDTEDGTTGENTHKPEDAEKDHGDSSDSQEIQHMASKRQKISQSSVLTVLENDHCSSSQHGKDNPKTQVTRLLPGECTAVAPATPAESAVSPTAVRNDRHLMEHTEIAQEEDITICPETQSSPAKQEESDKEDHADEIAIVPEPEACISAGPSDDDIICLDKMSSKNVACPMCGCNFPCTQIERHAAYCDGTDGQQEMTVLRPRSKLMRSHNSSTFSNPSADSGKCEKCYLCKSLVPLKEYQAHVDNCLQTAMLATQESQKIKSNKEYPGGNCRLLSMLEQSESSFAVKSNVPEPSHLSMSSPPREEHDDSLSSEHLNLSDSPIRSFVSISEATDCLVDFKKQFSRQPSGRRVNRRGRRRRK
ncbi:BRCA1-A complex subunit RAP80 isoform X2 [Dendropsophus ebraccatus]|uniref:BRCA1-A complex subunit RAP80 isoform X2 n=1 Tax=Dendropsophus ebraccatus TaxID=150705 RepID=UPI0038318B34